MLTHFQSLCNRGIGICNPSVLGYLQSLGTLRFSYVPIHHQGYQNTDLLLAVGAVLGAGRVVARSVRRLGSPSHVLLVAGLAQRSVSNTAKRQASGTLSKAKLTAVWQHVLIFVYLCCEFQQKSSCCFMHRTFLFWKNA